MPTLPALPDPQFLAWDLYCRVVDNLGDAGVCWRLASDLASRGHRVRLLIDDPAPLAFIAPQGAPGVTLQRWPDEGADQRPDRQTEHRPDAAEADPQADVVIGAFGCALPPAVIAAMARRNEPPLWINLEYLSAEAYVARSHGLPSPQPGGLVTWFYFPGFTGRSGGLLREPGLLQRRAAFDRSAWLAQQGVERRKGERLVSLFCYANPALPQLLHDLAREPTLLLLTQGPAQQQVPAAPPGLRTHRLPWLDQAGFDRMLWSADLNLVRGEDSLVRAIWAGAPFVWQAYPQADGAHAAKVEALIGHLGLPPAVAEGWRAWNGLVAGARWPLLPPLPAWRKAARRAAAQQAALPDLCTGLCAFVRTRRAAGAFGRSEPSD